MDNDPTPQNPFATQKGRAQANDKAGRFSFAAITYIIVVVALVIFWIIMAKGSGAVFQSQFPYVNTNFFTDSPDTLIVIEDLDGVHHQVQNRELDQWKADNPDIVTKSQEVLPYAGGGIKGPIVGTILLVGLCMIFTLFVGISTSIFLSEYAKPGTFLNTVRLAILNLAGVPSIVFGVFGLGFFCFNPFLPVLTLDPSPESMKVIELPWTDGVISFQGLGSSLIAGALTLALMILPVIITACEESLRAVPKGFREASLALGASKWQSIRTAVLPYAFSGMLTASILGITRVAGETAPIMFTAAVAYKQTMPWDDLAGSGLFLAFDFLTQQVQAMPYHIYTVAARTPQSVYSEPMKNGSVLVFMIMVMSLAFISVLLRNRIRRKIKW